MAFIAWKDMWMEQIIVDTIEERNKKREST